MDQIAGPSLSETVSWQAMRAQAVRICAKPSRRALEGAAIEWTRRTPMVTRRQAALVVGAAFRSFGAERETDRVRLYRVPNRGIQPQMALDDTGTLHLVYYTGDAHHGDLFYTRSLTRPKLGTRRRGRAVAAG